MVLTAGVGSCHMAASPWLKSVAHWEKPASGAPGSPYFCSIDTYVETARCTSGLVSCACHAGLNQRPPNELITGSMGARFSPQPGSPRRQIPDRFFAVFCIFAAIWLTWVQVGCNGILIPALAMRSLRYMRNDDSP